METVNVNIRMPKVLWDHREKLRQITGARSVNAMLVGAYAYAMYHGREHWFTNALFQQPPEQFDESLEGIVIKFLSGETHGGGFMEHSMESAVERVAKGKKIPKAAVVAELLSELRAVAAEERKPPRNHDDPKIAHKARID